MLRHWDALYHYCRRDRTEQRAVRLILNGWLFSSDWEKQQRFEEHLRYERSAANYGGGVPTSAFDRAAFKLRWEDRSKAIPVLSQPFTGCVV